MAATYKTALSTIIQLQSVLDHLRRSRLLSLVSHQQMQTDLHTFIHTILFQSSKHQFSDLMHLSLMRSAQKFSGSPNYHVLKSKLAYLCRCRSDFELKLSYSINYLNHLSFSWSHLMVRTFDWLVPTNHHRTMFHQLVILYLSYTTGSRVYLAVCMRHPLEFDSQK